VIVPAALTLTGLVDVEPGGSNGVKVWLCAESGTAITSAATKARAANNVKVLDLMLGFPLCILVQALNVQRQNESPHCDGDE
jgi:hypothetical protein